ncbi:beta strand repeat-containing protein [Scytonema sp. PRP1]|uniref:beta strand repeat-containing protein n=1 Tax=Scytonema sp. PRP1 TaxID=3120513 RepID=UPI00300DBBF8
MARNWQDLTWKLGMMISLFTGGVFTYFGNSALAQITPDRTLGTEGSVITPLSPNVDRIDGGAIRGSNLFHSFEDFNIGEGRGAYFANPTGIENILSRVTGGNASKIFGTLGVLGNANLYLLNPNGIIFGPNARLDIRGSFVGSTADSIVFGDRTLFRATDTQTKPLLTVAVPVGLQYGTQQAGAISNAGNLAVGQGQKLALVGGTVTSSGQLTAPGGTVQVLGDRVGLLDNARIDVSGETGGGTVLIGGDFQGKGEVPNAARTFVGPGVTINADALTSGDGGRVIVWADEATGFYGNISARGGRNSGNGGFVEVSGKQNLIFRGNVDTSAINGNFGTLLLDPTNITIVNGVGGTDNAQVAGDAQIFAGENPPDTFTISEATLESLSATANIILEATNDITINDLADNELFLASAYLLPPGSGGSVNFRADADNNGAGAFVMDSQDEIFAQSRNLIISGASVTIGRLRTSSAPTNSGSINVTATNGNITTGGYINATSVNGSAGSIIFNSPAGAINTTAGALDTRSTFGEAGEITLSANGNITTTGLWSNVEGTAVFNGRNITLTSTAGEINTTAGVLQSYSGGGDGGTVTLNADRNITTGNILSYSGSNGKGGDIALTTNNGSISTSNLNSSAFSNTRSGGKITLEAAGSITTDLIDTVGVTNLLSGGGGLNGADVSIRSLNGPIRLNGLVDPANNSVIGRSITINTPSTLDVAGTLNARSDVSGSAGNIAIGNISKPSSITVGVVTTRNLRGSQAGNINITTTGSLTTTSALNRDPGSSIKPPNPINDGFSIGSEALGNGGTINITADGGIDTAAGIVSNSRVSGNGGDITLTAKNGAITIKAGTVDSSSVSGNAGAINFNAGDNITTNNVLINASSILARGNGGNVNLSANRDIFSGSIESVGQVGGRINLNSGGNIFLNKADIASITTGSNTGSNISFTAKQVELIDARIGNIKSGEGQGGNISVNTSDFLNIQNTGNSNRSDIGSNLFEFVKSNFQGSGLINTTFGNANSGNIEITTKGLSIQNQQNSTSRNSLTGIGTLPLGDGNAGNITVEASDFVRITGNDSTPYNTALPDDSNATDVANKKAGDIQNIRTGITSAITGKGNAGEIKINTGQFEVRNTAAITSGVTDNGRGRGNNITVKATSLELQGKAALATASRSESTGNVDVGNLNIDAGKVTLLDGALLSADTFGAANGGDLNINTNELNISSGSRVGASTFGNGQGGTVRINSGEKKAQLINIDGTLSNGQLPDETQGRSGIFTESRASGTAGDIEIYTDKLNVLNRGEVSVSGSETGASGTLNVTAGNIFMTQQAGIRATTNSSGGNINLTVADSIIMRNNSDPNNATEITARAFGTANGGNIRLRVGKFVLADLYENSDIVAEADQGSGGRIDAKDVKAIEFIQHIRGRRLPESEFIASSLQGLEGTINVDPSSPQPVPVPNAPVVREIVQVCPTSPGATTREAGTSKYFNSGRGGLPPNPGEALDSNIPQVPWVTLDSDNQNPTSAANSTTANISSPETIEEAQGWVKLPNGKFLLTKQTPTSSSVTCVFQSSQQ